MSFGIANNVRSEVRVCTPDLLNQALDSPQVAKICAEIEDSLEKYRRGELTKDEYETMKGELKKKLPIFTFHATFKNGRRKNEDAVPSGLSIYDLDHIENPRAKWDSIKERSKELGIVLAHISPSLEGLRLVFVMPNGMNLAQAQAWMAEQLGDAQYDACVKDFARCSFVVPREYILYLNEEGLFAENLPGPVIHTPHNVIQSEAKDLVNTQESVNVDAPEILRRSAPLNDNEVGGFHTPLTPSQEGSYPETYEDIPYETIVEVLEEQMGGQPEHGSRNNFIFSMACHLRYVTNDEAAWIAQILPTYGESKEKWMASIRSACNRNQTKQMPRIMRRTLAICKQRQEEEGLITQNSELDAPPPMPKRLPPYIKLLVSRTPAIYKSAVAHAIFPSTATHLHGVQFRYIDNVLHEATFMNTLMADTSAGKNCINAPINYIMADIRQRDAENLRREREWKAEMNTKGANKDKRQRPEGLVIQEIDPDMTNAAFVQRLADADGRFLYTKMNEIDQFDALKTSARSKAQFQIMCLAFDPGNTYGQTRVGTSSVSERVCIRFNWNASTTVRKGQSYFRSVLTDGPISRINFCTIPRREIGAEMPVYGTYDEAFAEELRPYIERLNKARGVIECKQATALAKKLMEECAEFARLSQSRVYESLSFRANVIAFLKAMVLYVVHGERWDKTMEDFVRWSLRYDLWCKMKFFGEAIEAQESAQEKEVTRGPQNLLDLLPEIFTREDAHALRQRMGIRSDSLRQMLFNWRRRGYIEIYGEEMTQKDIDRQRYIKTEEYLKKHPQMVA